jgi:selenocysteine-specific translation elongation factor
MRRPIPRFVQKVLEGVMFSTERTDVTLPTTVICITNEDNGQGQFLEVALVLTKTNFKCIFAVALKRVRADANAVAKQIRADNFTANSEALNTTS